MGVRKIFVFSWILISSVLAGCEGAEEPGMKRLHGYTMGTVYQVTYEKPAGLSEIYTFELDSVLEIVNNIASTYIPSSLISRLNQGEEIDTRELDEQTLGFFRQNVSISRKVWEWSDGYFDPTVMPLVNYWGFGYEGHRPVEEADSALIDSLKNLVGFDEVVSLFEGDHWKLPEGMQLDFSAVAKGAACDFLAGFLEKEGMTNYLIDIGGETLANGPGRAGAGWIIGINRPDVNAPADDLVSELAVRDQAVATSGNYRNFFESNGKRYGHTINPKTGFPEENDILSATVVTKECGMADALATAFMAMGLEKSRALLRNLPETDALLIYNNGSDSLLIYETDGMKKLKYNTP